MSGWKSKWSRDRLVKAADGERDPVDAAQRSAWLETSMTTVSTPRCTIAASSACSAGASGVVSAVALLDTVDAHADRADHPCAATRRAQGRLHQVGSGRLTGGSGDPDHRQLLGRVAVHSGRHRTQHRPRRRMNQHRHGRVRPQPGCRSRVCQHGHRAALDRVAHILNAVHLCAAERREQVAGSGVLPA